MASGYQDFGISVVLLLLLHTRERIKSSKQLQFHSLTIGFLDASE